MRAVRRGRRKASRRARPACSTRLSRRPRAGRRLHRGTRSRSLRPAADAGLSAGRNLYQPAMTRPPDPVVIAAFARTPMGGFQGALAGVKATELGAAAVRAAVERLGAPAEAIEQIFMGCVLPAGLGQAAGPPGRAGRGPAEVGRGDHGQQDVRLAACRPRSWRTTPWRPAAVDVIIAGGMESMTNAPYLMTKHRAGARIGHDTMLRPHVPGRAGGRLRAGPADGLVRRGDRRAPTSSPARPRTTTPSACLTKARQATESGRLRRARSPRCTVTDPQGRGRRRPGRAAAEGRSGQDPDPEARPSPRTARSPPPTPRSISDGAAALVMTRESVARQLGLTIVARVVGHAAHAHEPGLFTTAPVPAVQQGAEASRLERGRRRPVRGQRGLRGGRHDRPARPGHRPGRSSNVNGGACALGHPIGASGARILATLLAALEARGGKRGVASLCIGGGEATAMAVEAG